MNPKLEQFTESMKDERSKKVMFVAHCVLNENVRYQGGAFRRGCIDPIVDELQQRGIGIVQMKCPEQKAWGGVLRKYLWLSSLGAKNTLLFQWRALLLPVFLWYTRMRWRRMAKEVVSEIQDYVRSGFEVVGIIGIKGSPSCGISQTFDFSKSFQYFSEIDPAHVDRKEANERGIKGSFVDGRGIYMTELARLLKKKGLPIKFYEHDLPGEMDGVETTLSIEESESVYS